MSEDPGIRVELEKGYQATGNEAVDEVVGSLDRLEEVPVSEHAAAFEAAHERLRGELADAGGAGA